MAVAPARATRTRAAPRPRRPSTRRPPETAGAAPPAPRCEPLSRRVAGLEILHVLEVQQLAGLTARRDRLEQVPDVVADVVARQDRADEPAWAAAEDRHPARPHVPFAARELVDLVAGLAAEQLDELLVVARRDVHRERLGLA